MRCSRYDQRARRDCAAEIGLRGCRSGHWLRPCQPGLTRCLGGHGGPTDFREIVLRCAVGSAVQCRRRGDYRLNHRFRAQIKNIFGRVFFGPRGPKMIPEALFIRLRRHRRAAEIHVILYRSHDASSTSKRHRSTKATPQCAACSGTSEVGVIPGCVLVSSRINPSRPLLSSPPKIGAANAPAGQHLVGREAHNPDRRRIFQPEYPLAAHDATRPACIWRRNQYQPSVRISVTVSARSPKTVVVQTRAPPVRRLRPSPLRAYRRTVAAAVFRTPLAPDTPPANGTSLPLLGFDHIGGGGSTCAPITSNPLGAMRLLTTGKARTDKKSRLGAAPCPSPKAEARTPGMRVRNAQPFQNTHLNYSPLRRSGPCRALNPTISGAISIQPLRDIAARVQFDHLESCHP